MVKETRKKSLREGLFRDEDLLIRFALILLGIFLAIIILVSIRWRFQHDTPILLYIAYSIDHFGLVPYRDIFDINMPGTYFVYMLIGRLSAYTDLGVRLVDLFLFSLISAIGWLWMRQFGRRVAWGSVILWGLVYFGAGPMISLQREFIILLPLSLGIFVSQMKNLNAVARNSITGFLFGLIFTIKPHAAIALPILILFDFFESRQKNVPLLSSLCLFLSKFLLPAMIGFLLPVIGVFVYLWSTDSLNAFLEIVRYYWPLYAHLSGEHITTSGVMRFLSLIQNYRELGKSSLWLAPASFGVFYSLNYSLLPAEQKRRVFLLLGLAFCYSIYPAFSGQFWSYHWLLFLFFIIQLSSLCLIKKQDQVRGNQLWFPVIILTLTMLFEVDPPHILVNQIVQGALPLPKEGRVDEMASFLEAHLQAGDTVQPLDWTGGAVHAMLITKAQIATPFIYDFHFYHHLSSSYIQNLRQRFMAELEKAHPRYIIQVYGEDKPWVSGADTSREFPDLDAYLQRYYRIVLNGDGYFIYEQINGMSTP